MSDRDLDHFFGALYYETTAELLTPRMTAAEVDLLVRLMGLQPGDGAPPRRYVDLGCGHGRHVLELARRGVRGVLGLDRSLDYLRRGRAAAAQPGSPLPPYLCGDLRALPLRTAALDGAYAWYSGLFLFDEARNRAVLAEAARVLKPGAILVHHGANPHRLAKDPVALHVGRTRAGDRVEEVARFDAAAGREHLHRRLVRQSGEVVEGAWSIRHYTEPELHEMMRAAGFRVDCVDERGRPFDPARALDLVAVAHRMP